MLVRDAMTTVVVTIPPTQTLREAARLMCTRRVGAAVVLADDVSGVGILTERDVLRSVGAGEDPDNEHVADHLTSDVVFASPQMPLADAASAMIRGAFRHMIVLDGPDVVGMLSVRDIVRVWSDVCP